MFLVGTLKGSSRPARQALLMGKALGIKTGTQIRGRPTATLGGRIIDATSTFRLRLTSGLSTMNKECSFLNRKPRGWEGGPRRRE